MNVENVGWVCQLTATFILAVLAGLDIKGKTIPLAFAVILAGMAVLDRGLLMVFGITGSTKGPILSVLLDTLAGMLPGIGVLVASVVSRGQIGIGDGLLMLAIGGMLGGIQSTEVFILSLFLVFVFSCGGLILHRLTRTSALPFVPFYFAAYLGVVYL